VSTMVRRVVGALVASVALASDSSTVYFSNNDGEITTSPSDNGDIVRTIFPGEGKISCVGFYEDYLYFTDRVHNTLSKIDANGDEAAEVLVGNFSEPHDFTFVEDASAAGGALVYVADKGRNEIVRFEVGAANTTRHVFLDGLAGPVGVVASDGTLYFTENVGGTVKKTSLTTKRTDVIYRNGSNLRSLTVGAEGDALYFVEASYNNQGTVRRMAIGDQLLTDVFTALTSPNAVAINDDMMYVADDEEGCVYRHSLSTNAQTPQKDLECFVKAAAPRAVAVLASISFPVTSPATMVGDDGLPSMPSTDDAANSLSGAPPTETVGQQAIMAAVVAPLQSNFASTVLGALAVVAAVIGVATSVAAKRATNRGAYQPVAQFPVA